MAVPFYVPDEDEQRQQQYRAGSSSPPPPHSTATSATQTPLQSPISGDHLVQAIYDALYLLTNPVAGTPVFPSPPSSPSCIGYHRSNGNVFFARSNSLPRSPRVLEEIAARRQQWLHRRASLETPRRSRHNSTGTEYDDDEYIPSEYDVSSSSSASHASMLSFASNPPSSSTSFSSSLDEHFSYMEARECLPEFSGQVPIKKKVTRIKTDASSDNAEAKPKSKDQKFVWPTVVTAVVIAVGCGFLVTR